MVEHGCKASLLIGKVFAVIERIFVIFTKSTKRNAFLREHTKDVENCLKLKNLSKTRWSARAESVEAVWRSLEAIICALDDVKESDDKEAKLRTSAFLNDIVNIDFVCGLMFLKNIMPQTKTLSDYLQRKSVNVASALVELNSTQDCLKRMRSEDKNFNNQIEAASSVAKYKKRHFCASGSEINHRIEDNLIARSCKICEQWFPLIAASRNESQRMAEIENFLSLRLLATAVARNRKESHTNFKPVSI